MSSESDANGFTNTVGAVSTGTANTIPDGWSITPIGEFGFDISDGNYSNKYPKQSEFVQTGIPFIRANNIQNHTVTGDDMRFISPELHSDLKKGHLKKGDILISTRGDIGQIAKVPDKFVGSNINAQLVRINTKNNISPKYLLQFLLYDATREAIKGLETGTALKQLPVGKLKELEIVYPPLPEQKKIAAILSSVDDVIEKTQAQINKLKDLKTGMMQELLSPREGTGQPQGVGENGKGHTEFKDSPLGRIPVGWDVKLLPEVATYQNGKAFQSADYLSCDSEGHFLVKPVNLDPNGKINWNYSSSTKISQKHWDTAKAYRVGANEILMNLTAQSLDDEFLGRVCITEEGQDCILNQRIARINSDGGLVLQRYLFWALKGRFFRAHVERITQGSKVQHLYNSNLNDAPIVFPCSINVQEKICASLDSIEDSIHNKSLKLLSTKKIKKALMQDLLTGKVRVKTDS